MSTLTLLDAVNRTLKRVHLIQGESGALTTLTSGSYQTDVDLMVDAWNEVIRYMYDHSKDAPYEMTEGTITLVDATREYSLASDFMNMAVDTLVQQTDGYFVTPYPGGYDAMFKNQLIPSSYTGRPIWWVINPTNAKLRFDTAPTSSEAGDVYTYSYQKELNYEAAADTFPFSDDIVKDLVPAVAELWRRKRDQQFDQGTFNTYLAIALEKLLVINRRRWY